MNKANSSRRGLKRAALGVVASIFFASVEAKPLGESRGSPSLPQLRNGAPKHSDVVFSVRSVRFGAEKVAASFHATRIEWLYSQNEVFNSALRRDVPWLGLTINSTWPINDERGYARGFDDEKLVHPRMQGWGRPWLSTSSKVSRDSLVAAAKRAVALGANSVQVDDPELQYYAARQWGGDFQAESDAGFAEYIAKYPDRERVGLAGLSEFSGGYRDFLRQNHGIQSSDAYRAKMAEVPSTDLWLQYIRGSVLDFYRHLKKELKASATRDVLLSMNLAFLDDPSIQDHDYFLAAVADYGISETRVRTSFELVMKAATYRALGLGWAPSLVPASTDRTRSAIALSYALGGNPVVPWDVYVGNDSAEQPKRYFGSREDYGDLYDFVGGAADYLDGFEVVPLVGILVDPANYDREVVRRFARKLWVRGIPFSLVVTESSVNSNAFASMSPHKFLVIYEKGRFKMARPELNENVESDRFLDGLRLIEVAPGEGNVNAVLRMRPGDDRSLMLHLVDWQDSVATKYTPDCRRRIRFSEDMLPGQSRYLIDRMSVGAGHQVVMGELKGDKVEVVLSGCKLWDVLRISRPQ